MNLFKKYYVHESDGYFKSHHIAYIDTRGPFTRREAYEIALWRMNQASRIQESIIIHVNKDPKPKRVH